MNPIPPLINLLANGLLFAGEWIKARNNPRAVDARLMNEDTKKKDELREALKNGDIDTIRKHLS